MHELHTGFDYNFLLTLTSILLQVENYTNRVLLWGKKKFDFSHSKSSSGPISPLDTGSQFQCNTSCTDFLP